MFLRNALVDARLSSLAESINVDHHAAEDLALKTLERLKAAGDKLIEVKSHLNHGEFGLWLSQNCDVSERQAQRYMKLASGWKTLQSKTDTMSDLTLSKAIALLGEHRKSWTDVVLSEILPNIYQYGGATYYVAPVLAVFPAMVEDDWLPFLEDVGNRGIITPIEIIEDETGMTTLVDGRHRLMACLELSVTPKFKAIPYVPGDLTSRIIGLNYTRKSMTREEKVQSAKAVYEWV